MNFVEFVARVQLPKPEKFIWLMTTKNYPPTLWTNNDVYVIYIEFLDLKTTPMEQALLSIDTLLSYADAHEISITTVFDHMSIADAIHLLYVRKLSPWLLLMSKAFKQAITQRATAEQHMMLESLVRPDYWPEQFERHPTEVSSIKLLVSEMGI